MTLRAFSGSFFHGVVERELVVLGQRVESGEAPVLGALRPDGDGAVVDRLAPGPARSCRSSTPISTPSPEQRGQAP